MLWRDCGRFVGRCRPTCSTRLDYGNSMLAGLPVYLALRLQSVLNAVARPTYHLRRSDHITDALVCLHWLRVPERVQYKIVVLVYKVLHGLASAYLGPLNYVADLPGRRPLRFATSNRPAVPPVKLTTVANQTGFPRSCPSTDVERPARRRDVCRVVIQLPPATVCELWYNDLNENIRVFGQGSPFNFNQN